MAKCDEGYICEVCGKDVEQITDSDLYLRFVIGQLDPETLHTVKERHIRCNPTLAQFIVHDDFEPAVAEGDFDKRCLDPEFVRQRETLVTRGWQRLHEISGLGEVAITEYPLAEVRERLQREANVSSVPDGTVAMKKPLATHDYSSGGLEAAVAFFKRTRDELRTLRLVRVSTEWVRLFDVNGDYFELKGLGYTDPEIVPVLRSFDTPFKPESIHAPISAPYKEFKTGRRYPWAADRVM